MSWSIFLLVTSILFLVVGCIIVGFSFGQLSALGMLIGFPLVMMSLPLIIIASTIRSEDQPPRVSPRLEEIREHDSSILYYKQDVRTSVELIGNWHYLTKLECGYPAIDLECFSVEANNIVDYQNKITPEEPNEWIDSLITESEFATAERICNDLKSDEYAICLSSYYIGTSEELGILNRLEELQDNPYLLLAACGRDGEAGNSPLCPRIAKR